LEDPAAEKLLSRLKEAETTAVEQNAELEEVFDLLEEQVKQFYDPVQRNDSDVQSLEHKVVDSLHWAKVSEYSIRQLELGKWEAEQSLRKLVTHSIKWNAMKGAQFSSGYG
jgi:uncharacterized protein YhaN